MVLGAQLSGQTPGEMQEELSPERIQAPNLCRKLEHCRVKWPKANKEKEWLQFDVDTILEVTASTRHALHPPQEPQEVLSEDSGVAHKVTAWKEVERSAESDHHLRDTCYDRSREQDLGHCQHRIVPPAPTMDFIGKETSLKEIQGGMKKARTS